MILYVCWSRDMLKRYRPTRTNRLLWPKTLSKTFANIKQKVPTNLMKHEQHKHCINKTLHIKKVARSSTPNVSRDTNTLTSLWCPLKCCTFRQVGEWCIKLPWLVEKWNCDYRFIYFLTWQLPVCVQAGHPSSQPHLSLNSRRETWAQAFCWPLLVSVDARSRWLAGPHCIMTVINLY